MSASRWLLLLAHFALRVLQVCASAIILGIFAYFLAVLADHNLHIEAWIAAVAGIAGAATLYALLASICVPLGKKPFFAALGMIFDVAFLAAFIAIAIMTRDGSNSCSGLVDTPLGSGNADDNAPGYGDNGFGLGDGRRMTFLPHLRFVCRLQKAAFVLSIIGIFLFLASLFTQRLYLKSSKTPGPYASGVHHKATPDTTPSRDWRFWRYWRSRPASTESSVVSDDRTAVGSIPLTEQRPPSSAGRFGWGKDRKPKGHEPQLPPTKETPDSRFQSPGGYRDPYANNSPYRGWNNPVTHPSGGFDSYTYGRSGVDDSWYSDGYGYGDSHYRNWE